AGMGPAAEDALPSIEPLLSADDPILRLGAAYALQQIGHQPEQMKRIISEATSSQDPKIKLQAALCLAGIEGEADSDAMRKQQSALIRAAMVPNIKASPVTSPASDDPYEAELDLWNEAIRIDPSDSQAFCLRGDVFKRCKRYDEAVADLKHAVSLEPEN